MTGNHVYANEHHLLWCQCNNCLLAADMLLPLCCWLLILGQISISSRYVIMASSDSVHIYKTPLMMCEAKDVLVPVHIHCFNSCPNNHIGPYSALRTVQFYFNSETVCHDLLLELTNDQLSTTQFKAGLKGTLRCRLSHTFFVLV